MSGISTEDGKHSLTATRSGTLEWVFLFSCFNVVQLLDGCAISSLSLWHAMTLTI